MYKESPLRMKANIKMTVAPEATVLREYRLLRSMLSEIYHEKEKCSHSEVTLMRKAGRKVTPM